MTDYIRNKQGKVKPLVDKNVAFYFSINFNTLYLYKQTNTAKYLELKKSFLDAWKAGKII